MLIRIRFTIMAKGLLLVAVPLLFQLVLIGFITENGRQEHDADLSVAHSRVVLQQAERLLTRLGYAQTGIRGYVLTGNPVFTEPYDLAEQELPQRFDALKALLSDIPKQQAVLESIAIKTADWFVFHKENMRLVQIGARDEAVARIAGLTGKKQMDDIQREIAAFQTEMERLADERSQLRELNHNSFKWVIVVGTGVSVLLAVLLAVVFTRGISRRLAVLLANIHRLVQGRELTPPVGGSDEIATVDQTFREMAQTLAQSRDELAKHNRVLQSMLDNMGDGVIVVDETGKFLVFNPAAKRIMGMGPTDGTPGEWSDRYGVYLPDQTTLCPSEQLPIARAMRGEEVDAEEFFVRNPDKSAGTWITITARPLKDDCGMSRGGVAVFQDVTSRKQAEREMQRAFRLLDAARDAIFIFNLQTLRFSYVNQGAIEQVGYSRDELLQMTVLDIKSEFDELRFRQMIEPVLSGSVPSLTFSTIHRHKNGRNVPVEANLQCVTDASGTRSFVAIVRDITERQRIEKALRESEERLSLALKSGDVGTWSWDIANNSIIWDDYHHSLYGLQPGTFSGGYEDFMKLLHPEDRERVERAIVRSTQEDVEFENEYRVVWTDGSTHVLSTRGKVYRNETDQPQRMSGVTWDITEQRRNEAAMRQSDARNRAVLTTSLDAIITMDHQGRVVEFNPAAERVFGYAHDKVIGQDLAELIIPARFRDPHRQGMVRFRATGKARVLDQRL